jgi:hypothetical protein
VACRSVTRQRPRNKLLDNGRYYAAARKQQQRNGVFCPDRAEMLYKQDKWSEVYVVQKQNFSIICYICDT